MTTITTIEIPKTPLPVFPFGISNIHIDEGDSLDGNKQVNQAGQTMGEYFSSSRSWQDGSYEHATFYPVSTYDFYEWQTTMLEVQLRWAAGAVERVNLSGRLDYINFRGHRVTLFDENGDQYIPMFNVGPLSKATPVVDATGVIVGEFIPGISGISITWWDQQKYAYTSVRNVPNTKNVVYANGKEMKPNMIVGSNGIQTSLYNKDGTLKQWKTSIKRVIPTTKIKKPTSKKSGSGTKITKLTPPSPSSGRNPSPSGTVDIQFINIRTGKPAPQTISKDVLKRKINWSGWSLVLPSQTRARRR